MRFAHEIAIGTRRFRVPVLAGTNDQLVIEGLHDYDDEVFIALRRALAEPKPVILDVGGNIGQYVLRLKATRQDAELHTFEPFPKLAEILQHMVTLNGWRDVRVNQCVVGVSNDKTRLYFDGAATDTASTVAGFQRTNQHSIEVDCRTLDGYVDEAGLKRVDVLKIDVEGGELEVIQGAARVLEKFRPLTLLELLWTQNPEHLARQQRVIGLLHSAGYHFHLIKADGALEYQAVPQPDPHYRLLNFLVASTKL